MGRTLSREEYLEYLFMAGEASSPGHFSLFSVHDMMWKETFCEEISACLSSLPKKRMSPDDYTACDVDRYAAEIKELHREAADTVCKVAESIGQIKTLPPARQTEDMITGTVVYLKELDHLGERFGETAIAAGKDIDTAEKKITELTVALEAERMWLYEKLLGELTEKEYCVSEEVPPIEAVFSPELTERFSYAERFSLLLDEVFLSREKLYDLYCAALEAAALLVDAARARLPYRLGKIAEAVGLTADSAPRISPGQSVKDLLTECEKIQTELDCDLVK